MPLDSTVRRHTVVVIGAGFSGAATAFHLLGRATAGLDVVLVESAPQVGRGLAYATPSDSHRLNVPAGRLGLDPARESGFIDWLRQQGLDFRSQDFVPRRWLGAYVESELHRVADEALGRGARLRTVHGRAVDLSSDGRRHRVHLADGTSLAADQVVLATGYLPPALPTLARGLGWADHGMVADPWADDAVAASSPPASAQDILLVGSGLTAVDVCSQLMDAGFAGRVHLLSRRGLLPQSHRANDTRPAVAVSPLVAGDGESALRSVVDAVRQRVHAATGQGSDWRDVMSGLRPWTPQLWRRLDPRDRRRFLRHLQPFWDTHRHRVAPAIDERLREALAAGRVSVQAGRLLQVDRRPDGRLDAQWRPRGGGPVARFVVRRIINCTGPSTDLGRTTDPLLAALRDGGRLSPDELGLGLQVDDASRPVDTHGAAARGLHYVGPMLKAQHWEAIAVPELREHARDVALRVLAAHAEAASQEDACETVDAGE